jgi:16S rRNA (guanine527-N7)-methyltransferase
MKPVNDILAILRAGIAEHTPLAHPDSAAVLLTQYLQLLKQWNQAYNLTAVRDIHEMVGRHVFDSLAVLPWIKGDYVLDVGTGAGLPGIPLAIACPNRQFVLLDSNGKKTRFLQAVKHALALNNIEVVQTRVEAYSSVRPFDTIVSRAFAQVQTMIHVTQHLLASDGLWVAMKGPNVMPELSGLTSPYRIEQYAVPGMTEARCCVVIDNK